MVAPAKAIQSGLLWARQWSTHFRCTASELRGRCVTTSLQFLIDNLCANFTQRSIYRLLEALLAERPCTMTDIALAIADKDRSLDIGSAQTLAEAAVEAMARSGVIEVQDAHIYLAGSTPD